MRYELEVICITPSTGVFRESGKVAVLTYWKKADASHGKRVLTRRESRYIKTLYSGFYTRSGYMKYKDT
jgi:hypothetical protein